MAKEVTRRNFLRGIGAAAISTGLENESSSTLLFAKALRNVTVTEKEILQKPLQVLKTFVGTEAGDTQSVYSMLSSHNIYGMYRKGDVFEGNYLLTTPAPILFPFDFAVSPDGLRILAVGADADVVDRKGRFVPSFAVLSSKTKAWESVSPAAVSGTAIKVFPIASSSSFYVATSGEKGSPSGYLVHALAEPGTGRNPAEQTTSVRPIARKEAEDSTATKDVVLLGVDQNAKQLQLAEVTGASANAKGVLLTTVNYDTAEATARRIREDLGELTSLSVYRDSNAHRHAIAKSRSKQIAYDINLSTENATSLVLDEQWFKENNLSIDPESSIYHAFFKATEESPLLFLASYKRNGQRFSVLGQYESGKATIQDLFPGIPTVAGETGMRIIRFGGSAGLSLSFYNLGRMVYPLSNTNGLTPQGRFFWDSRYLGGAVGVPVFPYSVYLPVYPK